MHRSSPTSAPFATPLVGVVLLDTMFSLLFFYWNVFSKARQSSIWTQILPLSCLRPKLPHSFMLIPRGLKAFEFTY